MAIFYKAVRVDGFDFYTGAVDYASLCGTGESLPVKEAINDPHCCSREVYHASVSAADTLIGASWPCRLFEVEGDAVCKEDNKRGFFTLKVIRELPAWMTLGPNGEAVSRFIDSIPAAINSVSAEVFNDFDYEAWDEAWDAALDASWHAAWGASRIAAWHAAREAAREAVCDEAKNAARGAASALVVCDLISDEEFNVLTSPWFHALGPLPE